VGFRVTEAASKKFLEIDPEALNQSLLGSAIDYLTEKLKDIDSVEQPPSTPGTSSSVPKPAQKFCVANCGFFWG